MIDAVITWVNVEDPAWQAERDLYATARYKESAYNQSQFRNWDYLRYWFRGIERFAPWIDRVFFVTCGHLPEWLDLNNPK